jgi:hypothetical protein
MDSQQVALGLAAAAAVFALWAAIFATRADVAARKARSEAERRWDDSVRPVPHFNFTSAPSIGQPIELEVENLGGAVAAGAVIVQHGDDLFAGELSLPDKAPARRMLLPPVLKAWQRTGQPRTLMLVARDISGRTWDCLNGGKVVKEPKKWMAAQLREMRLQGIVDFPGITGGGK